MTVSTTWQGRDYRDMEDPNHPAINRGDQARADSRRRVDAERPMDASGLFVHTTLDQANRPIREFELPKGQTKRSTWLAPHMAPAMLQIGLTNNVVETRRQAQRFLAEHGL